MIENSNNTVLKNKAVKVFEILEKEHPDSQIALQFRNPLELIVATILSAQCTDKRVNMVTENIFKKYTTPEDYANSNLFELERDIKSTGFYHNKARNIQKCCKKIVEEHKSQIPQTMKELLELAGVARKTANIVLQKGFGIVEGIAVDTHVRRLSKRIGLTKNDNPDKIEKDLMKILTKDKWMRITDLLIFHGRRVCDARKPKCEICVLYKICSSAGRVNLK